MNLNQIIRDKLQNKFVVFIGTFIIAVVAVYYIRNQSVMLLSDSLDYEIALAVTTEKAIETECCILRDEMILTTNYNGVIVPAVDDGGRVAMNTEAVRVYSNYVEADADMRRHEIDRRLEVLENSKINTSTVETKPDRIDDEIELLLDEIVIANADNDLQASMKARDELLVQMNKRWLYSTGGSDFKPQIKALDDAKKSLASGVGKAGHSVMAHVAGYYYSNVDGYENIFDSDAISDMTLESYDVMVNTPPMSYAGNVCGKLVTDHIWYVMCKVSSSEAYYFDGGKIYDVEFTSSSGTVVPMELNRKISENGMDDVVRVFSSSTLPDNFEYVRKQPIRLVYESYSGLRVPKDTVRVIDGVKGVFVTGGTMVRFKMINDVYSFGDYYIVDPEKDNYPKVVKSKVTTEDGEEKVTYYPVLSLYDRIIVGTDELYDGMELK
jgi:hypothetical protein